MVGRLRHFVRVEEDTGADGDNLPTFTTQIESLPCLIRPLGGYESFRGHQIESGVTYVVETSDCPEYGRIKGSARLVVLEGPYHVPQVLNVRYDTPEKRLGQDSGKLLFCSEQVT